MDSPNNRRLRTDANPEICVASIFWKFPPKKPTQNHGSFIREAQLQQVKNNGSVSCPVSPGIELVVDATGEAQSLLRPLM